METSCDHLDLDNRLVVFGKYLEHANLKQNSYQFEGVRWCLRNELYPYIPNIRGGFLADEMGLGKTIMMIGLFLCNIRPRTLVVVPPALINQWHSQILKTTGHNAVIFHGQNKKYITLTDLQNSCIVITTYGTIISNTSASNKNILYDIRWGRIVFDEAHHLRNAKTKKNLCVSMLKTDIRWLVSGTPIQNSVKDLRTLFRVLGDFPAHLITKKNVCFILRNYMLRRTKIGVGIDIPDMSVNYNIVEWSSKKEKQLSEDIHSSLGFSNVPCNPYTHLFCDIVPIHRIMLVRQVSIYPPLIKKLPEYYGNEHIHFDSKIKNVADFIISRKDNGNGKIVFCHFNGEIGELSARLADGGCRHNIIDGRVSLKDRESILADTYDVILLQIQCCCEGLNLQDKYSEVYFVSPHWNPAIEDQAIARCHRIGQKKNVSVFKFVMSNRFVSIPEKSKKLVVENINDDVEEPVVGIDAYICNKQDFKRKLASDITQFASS